jgi:fatty acid desaturase
MQLLAVLLCNIAMPASSFSFNLYQMPSNMMRPRVLSLNTHSVRSFQGKLRMAASVSLDSNEFDQGDANPVASFENLEKLVPRAKITELIKQTSDAEGLLQVAWHAGCFAVGAAVSILGSYLNLWPLSWLGMFFMAFVTSFNFMALHETVHRSAFKSRWLNFFFMHVAGFLCLRPAIHYFYYHWGHHKYTGNPAMDSELQPSALDMDVSTIPGYLLYISGLPFWFDAITTTLSHAVGHVQPHEKYLGSARARAEVASEARVYTLLYAAILAAAIAAGPAGPGPALLQYWVLPSVLGQPMLRFYLFTEHRGCRNTPDDILANTRSTVAHPLYRRMAWQVRRAAPAARAALAARAAPRALSGSRSAPCESARPTAAGAPLRPNTPTPTPTHGRCPSTASTTPGPTSPSTSSTPPTPSSARNRAPRPAPPAPRAARAPPHGHANARARPMGARVRLWRARGIVRRA